MLKQIMADRGKWLCGQISTLLHFWPGDRTGGGIGILMYHRIARNTPGLTKPTINVTPERFRQQLEGLLARGYRVWPLPRVIHYAQKGLPWPPQTTLITFDDGFENIYRSAWPILKKLHLPATIFVATAYLDSNTPFPFDQWGLLHHRRAAPEAWKPLTWAQCAEMMQNGLITIGSHTHTHGDFRSQPHALKEDLLNSLTMLHNHLGEQDYTFAFPYGRRGPGFAADEMMNIVKEVGLACALTTEIGLANPRNSPFGWGRLEAVQFDTGTTLAAKLAGCYNWVGPAREIFNLFSLNPEVAGKNRRKL